MAFGGRTATLTIQILGDAAKAQDMFGNTAKDVGKTEAALNGMAGPAALALGGIAALGTVAVGEASKMEQSFGALEAVFGDQAGAAEDLARRSAQSVGLASADYAQMAAVLGAQLRDMGVAEEDLIPTTEALIARGGDMAAMYGGTTADAVSSISSLLRGERDPIEKYAVSIKESTVQAELAARGLSDLEGEAKTTAATQATLSLLMDKSAVAAGTFGREADSAAGSTAIAEAEWRNTAATLGEVLLPVVSTLATVLASVAGWMSENSTLTQVAIGVIGGLAAAILAANLAIKAWNAVMAIAKFRIGAMTVAQHAAAIASKIWTGIQWLLNAALSANPIGLVVAAIALLVGAFVLAYNKSETFRRIVDGVFRAVQRIVGDVVDFIVRLFGGLLATFRAPFESLVGIVRSVFATIEGIVRGSIEFISGLLDGISSTIGSVVDALPGGKSAPLPPATAGLMRFAGAGVAATTSTVARRSRGTAAPSGGVVINISGAIDAEGTARQVARLLAQHGMRTGRASTLVTGSAL